MGKFQLRLINSDGDYIILQEGNEEYVRDMMRWYIAHKSFFNGSFAVVEGSN